MSAHPWVLVAPWYRWDQPGVPRSGRDTAPVFQKFSSDTFVLDFLANPQRSLRFEDPVDRVQEIDYFAAPPPVATALAGKVSSLFPLDKSGNKSASLTSLRTTEMRKIYLDIHSRHYLVVCELHCDLAGFPCPDAREVCQTGLVVRRKRLSYPESARAEARSIVRDLVAVESRIRAAAGKETGGDCGCGSAPSLTSRLRALFKTSAPSLLQLQDKRAELEAKLAAWRDSSGAHSVLEGWIAGDRDRIGSWGLVEDSPQDLVESWYPMWPLFADPANPSHDATGRTIFYGVLPTSSFDTDTFGKSRYDDSAVYEIRCFVRRHDPRCPRGEPPDCHGDLIWSLPTERYRIAPQFDLQGTSNRPITIQMPNLAELAAQAVQKPLGKFSPVKVIQPQALAPKVSGGTCTEGSMGGPAICFISIPLITIVALFVFNIFLPIVVFVFGLWFLLAFKFCIPPQVSFDVDLQLKLDAAPPKLDADFSVNVDVGGSFELVTAGSLNADLQANLASGFSAAYGFDQGEASGKLLGFSNEPLADLAEVGLDIQGLPGDASADPPLRGTPDADLQFEAHVDPPRRAA